VDISTVSVLIIVALVAALLAARGRRVAFIAVLLLLGALLGNTGGTPGQIMDTASTWVLGFPGLVASLFTPAPPA
jgi:hypothetical protein